MVRDLLYPQFLKCCQHTDDVFWRFVFEEFAWGKLPYGVHIVRNICFCNFKEKSFSFEIDIDERILCRTTIQNLRDTYGMQSPQDRLNHTQELTNLMSNAMDTSITDWCDIKKKGFKSVLIDIFVAEQTQKYNLHIDDARVLRSLLKTCMLLDAILPEHIHMTNGRITSINHFSFADGSYKIDPEIEIPAAD